MKELGYYDLNFDVNVAIDEMFNSFDQVIYIDTRSDVISDIKDNKIFFTPDYENMNAEELFDYFRDNLIFKDDREIFNSIALTGRLTAELRRKCPDGKYRWCYLEVVQVSRYEFLYMFLDLTGCKNDRISAKNKYIEIDNLQKMQYKKNSHKYRVILEQTNVVLYEWYPENDAVIFSDNASKHFNVSSNSAFSLNTILESGIIHEDDIVYLKEHISNINIGANADDDIKVRLKNFEGKYIWYKISFSPVTDENGNLIMMVGTILDVDEATNYLLKLKYRAEVDKLTGLSNMYKFMDDMDMFINKSKKKNAMISFDIEKFKVINEIYGMEFADNLLRYIAKTVKEILNPEDLAGRFSGDCFGIFMEYDNDNEIVSLIEKINICLSFYKGAALTVVFGIYRIKDRNIMRRKIVDYANMAKATIKGNNVKRFAFYEDSMLNKMLEEQHIENDMDQALSEGQFSMFLQPKYNIQNSKIIGAEALVRWIHPQKGMVMPNKFIDLFEKNGFVVKLDRYMWEKACMQIRKWMDDGLTPVPISVNVSRVNVGNPDLVDIFDNLVDRYQIDKKYLELEITETVYYDNQKILMVTLERLKESGYTLLMDDFGSGFSSLNMLKNTPFDVLKIDRNFLNETMITDKGKKIINHTIRLSNDIGMGIVAEGVETKEQADYLLECGCFTAQGYYYSKPVSLDEFDHLFYSY